MLLFRKPDKNFNSFEERSERSVIIPTFVVFLKRQLLQLRLPSVISDFDIILRYSAKEYTFIIFAGRISNESIFYETFVT